MLGSAQLQTRKQLHLDRRLERAPSRGQNQAISGRRLSRQVETVRLLAPGQLMVGVSQESTVFSIAEGPSPEHGRGQGIEVSTASSIQEPGALRRGLQHATALSTCMSIPGF